MKQEFIEHNNLQVKILYDKLINKYKNDLTITFDDKLPFHKLNVLYLNSEVLEISVGARPSGKTEWYVDLYYRKRKITHSHWLEDEIYDFIQEEYEELDLTLKSYPKMEFIGRNDGYAMCLNNHVNLMKVFYYTIPLYLVSLISFVFNVTELGWITFSFPTFFFVISYLVFAFKKLEDNFLKFNKQEHTFLLENAVLIRDNKEVKDITKFTTYKYRNVLLIKSSRTFYVVKKEDCVGFELRHVADWFRLRGANTKMGLL